MGVIHLTEGEGREERGEGERKRAQEKEKENEEGEEREEQDEKDEDSGEEAEIELSRLKELVPSVSVKDNVSQLDVILEAISYIASLQGRLADRIEAGEVPALPALLPATREGRLQN